MGGHRWARQRPSWGHLGTAAQHPETPGHQEALWVGEAAVGEGPRTRSLAAVSPQSRPWGLPGRAGAGRIGPPGRRAPLNGPLVLQET